MCNTHQWTSHRPTEYVDSVVCVLVVFVCNASSAYILRQKMRKLMRHHRQKSEEDLFADVQEHYTFPPSWGSLFWLTDQLTRPTYPTALHSVISWPQFPHLTTHNSFIVFDISVKPRPWPYPALLVFLFCCSIVCRCKQPILVHSWAQCLLGDLCLLEHKPNKIITNRFWSPVQDYCSFCSRGGA